METGQADWRNRLFLIWFVATLIWAAAATAFFPLQEAASAIWRNAPNAAQQVSMFNMADKSFSFCMQQPRPADENADIAADRARLAHCTSLKDFLYGQTAGMPRDSAWSHVGRFAAATLAGALGIAALMLAAWRLHRGADRTTP